MKSRNEYSESEYYKELITIWQDLCRQVYLKESKGFQEMGDRAWNHTNMTPLEYVIFTGNPSNVTNQINRGQKAREKRWKIWLKTIKEKHENL